MPIIKKQKSRTSMIGVRVDEDEKYLVDQAAEHEGLETSSFILMVLVRTKILTEKSIARIRRRPIPFYNVLHDLSGVLNKINGNCKQLVSAMPEVSGVCSTQAAIYKAAAIVSDMLCGRPIPIAVNLYTIAGDLTKAGYAFNAIVHSVNKGQPNLSDLPAVLHAIGNSAEALTTTFTTRGGEADYVKGVAQAEMRLHMKASATKQTTPKKRSV